MTWTHSSKSIEELIQEAMNVKLVTGNPGDGKTELLLDRAINQPGLYLMAQPRKDLIAETKFRLESKTSLSSRRPAIIVIHSDNKPDKNRSVLKQIQAAPKEYASLEHVIVLTTHEGAMGSDMSGYDGWHMLMDEVANPIKSNSIRIPVAAKLLSEYISLEPTGCDNWSSAKLRSNAPSLSLIYKDSAFKELAELFKIMQSQRLLWLKTTDLMEFYYKQDRLTWFTYWDLRMLSAFKSVTIAGAGFRNSLLYKAMGPHLNLTEERVVRQRTGVAKVKIRYFTSGHRSSTAFWKTVEGKRCLKAVADFYAMDPDANYYWSGNDEVSKVIQSSMKGLQVRPKLEGLNSLMSYPRCVFLYSSKMLPEDQPTCHLLNIVPEDFEVAREFEDIRQFLMRGAPRNPDFDGEYVIDVYDNRQAQMVAEYVHELGLGTTELVPLDEVGIMNVIYVPSSSSKSGGAPAKPKKTPEEIRAYDRDYKRKRRARQKALQAPKTQNPAPTSGVSPTGP